jgi:hypothetical protein
LRKPFKRMAGWALALPAGRLSGDESTAAEVDARVSILKS